MNRSTFLRIATLGLGAMALSARVWAASPASTHRLGAAWRRGVSGTGISTAQDFVGVLAMDWDARQVRVQAEHAVPSRAHGLMAENGGGFLVVAARPGTWLRRLDSSGQVVLHHSVEAEHPARSLAGHVVASADGQWLYTTENDRSTGAGWVSVRNVRDFSKQAEWPSHGRDPHQCLVDASGALLVANGGIPRTIDGKKRDLEQMDSSLVRLDGGNGALLGQWRLDDPRLSLRHMAWSGESPSVLGIALQAEHDDPGHRTDAPVLAVWDGQRLSIPSRDMAAGGYAGDIAPGPGGGFVLSGQRVGRGVLWHPDAPRQLLTMAELQEVCALAVPEGSGRNGVLMGATRGVALWHPGAASAMLPWPGAMTIDNHWVLLA